MDIFEVIESRYSCRKLKPSNISDADLDKILDAGRRAPSGYNKQPYELLVIKDSAGIQKIADSQSFAKDADLIIGIIGKPELSPYWLEDISAVAENMLLAITALGYATTWIEGRILPAEGELKKYFNIPEKLRFMIVLPIGKPAESGKQAPKKSLDELTHREKW